MALSITGHYYDCFNNQITGIDLPTVVDTDKTYKGVWNATTNTPTLTSSSGLRGDYYVVTVAGTTLIDGISTWGLNDHIIYNGNAWMKINNPDTTVSKCTILSSGQTIFVPDKGCLPTPVGGVITLLEYVTYIFTGVVDLTGDRLVCGESTTIIGYSSENCRIKSTGLVSALITSIYTIPIRHITLEAALVLDLQGTGPNPSIDWYGVNFTNCAVIGLIKNYANAVIQSSAFLNSSGLTFDGTIGTISFGGSLFECNSGGTVFILPATLIVTRRFRITYSSFVVLAGETGINHNAGVTVPVESLILNDINFGGGGSYLVGLSQADNFTLFRDNVGIENTSVSGSYSMNSNATATTITLANTYYKILGTTISDGNNSKFTATDNRLTCNATIARKFLIIVGASVISGNNKEIEFAIYDSQTSAIITKSQVSSTTNSGGKAEGFTAFSTLRMLADDYIEIWCRNITDATDVTVTSLHVSITEV